jgi:SPOR domain
MRKMRGWFYALLLLNIAFFGWAHWIDVPTAAPTGVPAAAGTARSLPTLALVRASGAGTGEAGATGGGAAASAPGAARSDTASGTASSAGIAGERCRSLGPFADAASATRASGLLRGRGLVAHERDVAISVNDGYTVYVDQPGDAAAVRRTLGRLQRAGIAGVNASSGSGGTSRISFGAFSDQAHAVRRAEQLRQLGLKPVLDINQSTLTTRWLDLTLQANQPVPPVTQLLGGGTGARGAGGAVIQFSDCPAQDANP